MQTGRDAEIRREIHQKMQGTNGYHLQFDLGGMPKFKDQAPENDVEAQGEKIGHGKK